MKSIARSLSRSSQGSKPKADLNQGPELSFDANVFDFVLQA
jgi:hypothetical protein